jgi:fructosamine-3-kinase
MWNEIASRISQATGKQFEILDRQSVSGGCINRAYMVSNKCDRYFVKLNQPDLAEMFVAEMQGLAELAATVTIKVPLPICWGVTASNSYLVLECLDLTERLAVADGNRNSPKNWLEMGRKLAMMHDYPMSNSPKFGWQINNTIGATPQLNTWETDWTIFFKNHRIGYQLQLAQRKGGNFPKADRLLDAIPEILGEHQPQPSLVHGDLWSGNASFTTTNIPVIFDPATYWGDLEVDIAMTELFGGFPAAFYQGYASVYSLDPGYERRKHLYNLYHILNHYNLFGGSYQSQANSAIELLLR